MHVTSKNAHYKYIKVLRYRILLFLAYKTSQIILMRIRFFAKNRSSLKYTTMVFQTSKHRLNS